MPALASARIDVPDPSLTCARHGVATGSIFDSMPEFWRFLEELVKKLPTENEDPDPAGRLGWEGFNGWLWPPSLASDSDVANLCDLEAFGLPDESWPDISPD